MILQNASNHAVQSFTRSILGRKIVANHGITDWNRRPRRVRLGTYKLFKTIPANYAQHATRIITIPKHKAEGYKTSFAGKIGNLGREENKSASYRSRFKSKEGFHVVPTQTGYRSFSNPYLEDPFGRKRFENLPWIWLMKPRLLYTKSKSEIPSLLSLCPSIARNTNFRGKWISFRQNPKQDRS